MFERNNNIMLCTKHAREKCMSVAQRVTIQAVLCHAGLCHAALCNSEADLCQQADCLQCLRLEHELPWLQGTCASQGSAHSPP